MLSKLYPSEGELLVQVFERSETDSAAMSGERSRKTNRRVKLVTDYPEPLTLHWGVARDEPPVDFTSVDDARKYRRCQRNVRGNAVERRR